MRSDAAPEALHAIPCFAFPEPAAIAMARVAAYAEWRLKKPGIVPMLPDVQPSLARLVVERALDVRVRVADAHGEVLTPTLPGPSHQGQ